MSDSRPPIYFGMQLLPDEQFATQHFAFAGASGSGKTTFIKLMIQSVFLGLRLSKDARALLYDFKSEFYAFLCAVLGRFCPDVPLYCVNPFDARAVWWAIGEDVQRESDAQQIAAILIPAEPGEKNVYYRDAARSIIANIIISFCRYSPGQWTWRDLFCALSDKNEYQRVLRRDSDTAKSAERTGSDEVRANIDSTLNNIYYKFRTLAALMDGAQSNGHPSISLKHWVQNPGIILANFDQTVPDILEPYYQLFLHVAKQHILALPDSIERRTWIFLDEFPTLKPIPGFSEFVTNARSKGACLVLGFQNITSLMDDKHYGNFATSIIGECKNKMLFKASSFEHAEWCAKEYGMHEFLKDKQDTNESLTIKLVGPADVSRTSGHHNAVDFDHSYLRIPGEFQALSLVAESGRFEAFSILRSARIPCSLDFQRAIDPLIVPDPCQPGFLPAPAHWETLRPWGPDDYGRLQIPFNQQSIFQQIMELERNPNY